MMQIAVIIRPLTPQLKPLGAPTGQGKCDRVQMVGEVARGLGLSLFGGASSEVRRCKCSVVVLARASFLVLIAPRSPA